MTTKIIIINGKGKSGKDTVINWIKSNFNDINIYNFSSIDPSKQAAEIFGCYGKSDRDRKFLSKLKELSIWYNDHPTIYLYKQIKSIYTTNNIVFLHIREAEEIEKMRTLLYEKSYDAYTLYIHRNINDYGNKSDDNVENYVYDYYIDNSKEFEYTIQDIKKFLTFIGMRYDESKYIEKSNTGGREE